MNCHEACKCCTYITSSITSVDILCTSPCQFARAGAGAQVEEESEAQHTHAYEYNRALSVFVPFPKFSATCLRDSLSSPLFGFYLHSSASADHRRDPFYQVCCIIMTDLEAQTTTTNTDPHLWQEVASGMELSPLLSIISHTK